jgi:hypothetical protein
MMAAVKAKHAHIVRVSRRILKQICKSLFFIEVLYVIKDISVHDIIQFTKSRYQAALYHFF